MTRENFTFTEMLELPYIQYQQVLEIIYQISKGEKDKADIESKKAEKK